ncbi:conserved hypothetical protein [Tenacibaculum sp. 190524A05c]|uniref:hypothetical protein n=1 Tax=Tenacibaculum platacis TaxID=3137852 RepID=UPI0031FB411A
MRTKNFNGLQSLSSHATLMMTILKNNKRNRINVLKKIGKYSKSSSSKLVLNKTITKENLLKIKDKIQKQNRKNLAYQLTFVSVFSLSVLFAIGFVKF